MCVDTGFDGEPAADLPAHQQLPVRVRSCSLLHPRSACLVERGFCCSHMPASTQRMDLEPPSLQCLVDRMTNYVPLLLLKTLTRFLCRFWLAPTSMDGCPSAGASALVVRCLSGRPRRTTRCQSVLGPRSVYSGTYTRARARVCACGMSVVVPGVSERWSAVSVPCLLGPHFFLRVAAVNHCFHAADCHFLRQRANDVREITGRGFAFLKIPRSYYGYLKVNDLATATSSTVCVRACVCACTPSLIILALLNLISQPSWSVCIVVGMCVLA